MVWQLPHETHRYFFEHLTECRHLKILLIRRFLNFANSIVKGEKSSCKILLRTIVENCNSTTGRNMRNIELEAGHKVDMEARMMNIDLICDRISFADIPDEQQWRIIAAKEATQIKSKHLPLEGFNNDEVD